MIRHFFIQEYFFKLFKIHLSEDWHHLLVMLFRQSSLTSTSHQKLTMSLITSITTTMAIYFLVLWSSLSIGSSVASSGPIDFSDVWFQHNNQILDIVDQLSREKSNQCQQSMQQLLLHANSSVRGNLYAKKSKFHFFKISIMKNNLVNF